MGQAFSSEEPPLTTGASSSYIAGVLIAFGVICLLALIGFVYLNRKRGNCSVHGCRIENLDQPSMDSLPSDLTSEAHHQAAIANPAVIVVHHSKHCGFCKKFRPVAEQVERESNGRHRIVFSDVSASPANQAYFQKLGESGVPTYAKAGATLGVGFKTAPEFGALLDRS